MIGVEARPTTTASYRVKARKAVIFATGGFTHDPELRKNFLSIPAYGGCAAMTNEGDFIRISSTLGVQLRNMNYAWMCPISFEKAIAKDPSLIGCFSVAGDSMIFVDKRGKRVVNEKLHYNELAQKFFEWDGANAQFPYLILISIWDQRAQDNSASHEYGRLIVPPGIDDRHVIKGATLEELAANIDARLQKYAGQNRRHAHHRPTSSTTSRRRIARFNELAKTGKDLDFHRGERVVELLFNGNVKEEPGRKNPTMWPISDAGPVLRGARHRRHARHQGRAEDQSRRSGAGHRGQADPRSLRRRQLRRLRLRTRLLGRRRHARAHHRVCLSCRQCGRQGAGQRLVGCGSRYGACSYRLSTSRRRSMSGDIMVRRAIHWRECAAGGDSWPRCALAMPLRAADDLSAARELTIRQCSQCHTFDKGEKHGQGPNLFGLLGREAAAAPGFVYSDGYQGGAQRAGLGHRAARSLAYRYAGRWRLARRWSIFRTTPRSVPS